MKPLQTRTNDTTLIEIMTLHQNEMQLIKAIRNNWRFGEVVIKVRDGLPYRLVRVQEFISLDGKEI